jgi:hypothetical protein
MVMAGIAAFIAALNNTPFHVYQQCPGTSRIVNKSFPCLELVDTDGIMHNPKYNIS